MQAKVGLAVAAVVLMAIVPYQSHVPYTSYAQSPEPINLVILEAAADGLRLVVNGVVTAVEGATITRINWDWGDGSSNSLFSNLATCTRAS